LPPTQFYEIPLLVDFNRLPDKLIFLHHPQQIQSRHSRIPIIPIPYPFDRYIEFACNLLLLGNLSSDVQSCNSIQSNSRGNSFYEEVWNKMWHEIPSIAVLSRIYHTQSFRLSCFCMKYTTLAETKEFLTIEQFAERMQIHLSGLITSWCNIPSSGG
jgi:hypothetical protein